MFAHSTKLFPLRPKALPVHSTERSPRGDSSEQNFHSAKLHQLTASCPWVFFLLEHFYTNSKALNALTGAAEFNNAVKDLQSIPYILFVEIGGIFIPLIYQPCTDS